MIILDGKKLSEKWGKKMKIETKSITPKMKVILVGKDYGSKIYVKRKKQFCEKIGIDCQIINFTETVQEKEILKKITELNEDENTHGFIVQLPLPAHINSSKIISKISPKKDIDGFTPKNLGGSFFDNREKNDFLLPATPLAVMSILDEYKIDTKGKNCVIIGHSLIVGRPLSSLLLARNATVTVCNIFTQDITKFTKQADIVISAVGKPKLIKANMLKNNLVAIDVGTSRDKNGKLTGDFDFDQVQKIASHITPVPGGVGPMTIASLVNNLIKATKNATN